MNCHKVTDKKTGQVQETLSRIKMGFSEGLILMARSLELTWVTPLGMREVHQIYLIIMEDLRQEVAEEDQQHLGWQAM